MKNDKEKIKRMEKGLIIVFENVHFLKKKNAWTSTVLFKTNEFFKVVEMFAKNFSRTAEVTN